MRNTTIICICAAALAAVSCSQKDALLSREDAIEFGGMHLTKALVTGVDDMKTGSLSLYGYYKSSDEAATQLFNNNTLAWDATTWKYSGETQYWVPGCNYTFMCAYPYSDSYTATPQSLTIPYTAEQYGYQAQKDILAGSAYRAFTKGGDTSPVNVEMSHILSAVEFELRNARTTSAEITNASLTGIYTAGTCTLTPATQDQKGSVSWVASGSRLTDTEFYKGDAEIGNLAVGTSKGQKIFKEKLLVVPQAISSDDIRLSFTVDPSDISGSSDAYTPSISLNSATGIKAWEPGKKYTYIATITESSILFAFRVNDWIEDDDDIIHLND